MSESTCWSGQPNYVERLETEIERLRAVLASSEMQLASNYRSRVIEECARVAETLVRQGRNGHAIANAIRALKDKP